MAGKNCRSGVGIAKMLGIEGFTPYVATLVRRWYRRRVASRNQRKRYEKARNAFRESVVPKLTDADRIVLGRFIGQIETAAFLTGMRMGLAVRLGEAEPWTPDPLDKHGG